MNSRLHVRWLSAALLLLTSARSEEVNYWPLYVQRTVEGSTATSAEWLGPLLYAQSGPATSSFGLRPVFQESQAPGHTQSNLLFPFFTWQQQGALNSFSFFKLVNSRTDNEVPANPDARFDVWPFYFSRQTGKPDESYRAFFPFGGTIKHRLGRDRITFALFPLYAHNEANGRQVTHAPWPFLRFIDGDGYDGFEFWPLFGRSTHDGDYDRQFCLWPLFYKSASHLSAETPHVKVGALPFYARDTGPGYISETFVWPFFGYTHRTAPHRYDEQRYLWPLLVQGRGDDRLVNRWAPIYTHSTIKGVDKTWLLWPLYRNQRWADNGIAQQKDQLLFFLYWSLAQRSLTNPSAAPARKTHLWPLFSAWDNGAGREQIQLVSPFEVFFPSNEAVRTLWSPLFAVYRYERHPDTSARHSLLWNAVTYHHTPAAKEFHLGPLFSVHADSARRRFALGNGLIGLQRHAGNRWRLFLFDFKPNAALKSLPAPPS